MNNIKSLFIFSFIAVVFVVFGVSNVSAQGFCGIGQGYQATININAWLCHPEFGGTFTCQPNGSWACNGSYPCTIVGSGSSCAYSSNQGACTMVVSATASCSLGTCNTGCNITNGGFSCNETRTNQSGSCWVNQPAPTNTPVPGCGTCGGCSPACGGQCTGSCSGNGQSCTIFGPPCGATNTPVPPTPTPICTIQGRKVIMPGNQQIAPAIGQTVTVTGYGSSTANPFTFTVPGNQSRNVSVTNISGYATSYSVCLGSTGCHTGSTNPGNSMSSNCPAGSYMDLWWHYTPNTPTPTPTTVQPTPTPIRNSSCVSHTIPTSMFPNTDYPVSVTLNNSGNSAWSSSAPAYLLGSADPQANTVWGLSSTPLDVTPVNAGQNTTFNFTISSPSTPGTYSSRWRMFQNTITWFGATCGPSTITVANATPTPTPRCDVSMPGTATINVGGTTSLTATLSNVTGTVDRVTFSSSNTADVTVSPASDSSATYQTVATGASSGSANVTATCYLAGSTSTARGSDFTAVTVNANTPTPVPPTATPVPCRVTTSPVSMSLDIGGDTGTVTASVTSGLGAATVDSMDFGVYDTNIATVPAADDTSSPFSTVVTSRSVLGSTAVWATATLSDGRTCQTIGTTDTDLEVIPVCSITTPLNVSMATGSTTNLGATIGAQSGGSVTRVVFTSSNTSRVTATSPDDSSPFSSTLTSTASVGAATVTATAFMNNNNADMICSDSTTVNVAAGPTATPAPDCDVSLSPGVTSINVGGTALLTATLSNIVGTVDRVTFSSSVPTDVTVAPASDSSSSYQTTATGVSSGSSIVTATCYLVGSTGTPRGTDTTTVNVSANTPTPTPTGAATPVSWSIITSPYCSAGGAVTVPLRMFNYVGPTAAPVYTQDGLATGDHTMNITSSAATDVVWVGMKNAAGDSFQATAITPSDADVSFGQDFTPPVWTAQWNRALVPTGTYTVDIEVDPTAPDSPTANTNPVVSNVVTLNWSPPADWGVACVPNNTYEVYFSQEAAGYSGYPNNAAPSPAPNFTCNSTACTGTPSTTTAGTSTTFAVSPGLRYCWAVVANNGALDSAPSNARCFDNVSGPWWQAAGGEAIAASGQIQSQVPGGEYLIEQVGGGRPGMAFGEILGPSLDGSTNVSVNDWWINLTGHNWNAILVKPENTYTYMRDRLLLLGNPSIASSPIQLWSGGDDDATKATVVLNGQTYYLYRANAPVTVQGLTNSARKVILMVDGAGDTTLADNLTFSAAGFALILSDGDIVVQPNVTALQGIYFTDGVFDTGTNTNVLTVNGTVVGMQGVTLGRTGGGANPSEIFSFRPDFTVLLNQLGLRKKIIQELVNP